MIDIVRSKTDNKIQLKGVQEMVKEEVQEALNEQINAELYSAYLYLSMAAYFENRGLSGFAHWMRVQEAEERMHAMKFFDFILERGGKVALKEVDAPPIEWDSPLATFEAVYAHEQKITTLINDLVRLARKHEDYATESFLTWFVDEQVEEERNVDDVLRKLKLIGDSTQGLLMLDRELSQRVPSAAGAA
jgi:ferritin